jgi:hypothetical protein
MKFNETTLDYLTTYIVLNKLIREHHTFGYDTILIREYLLSA